MNDHKAFDKNLDETIYSDVALDLISRNNGVLPSEDQIVDSANVSELDSFRLANAVAIEYENLKTIKKAIDENKTVEVDQTFKRNHVEFDQIHRFLYSLMSDAIKMSGEYVDSLSHFEEQLTPAEYLTLEAFYKWIEAGEMSDDPINKSDSREFGSGNYQARYDEWLATLRYELRAHQIVTIYEDAQTEKVVEGQAELLIKESTDDDGLQLWSLRFVGKIPVEQRKVKP